MSWVDEVLAIARGEIGTTEWPSGSNKVKYNTWYYGREVSGAAYPWCMAFVEWVFNAAGHALPFKTASCSALLNWYKSYKPGCVVAKPMRGAVVIYNFGHTGIVDAVNADGSFYAVEGNTSSNLAGSQSNGGGVFRPLRYMSQVTKFIIPFEIVTEEGDIDMTGEEIVRKINEYTSTLKVPDWAKGELQEAVELGITDGSNPTGLIPRYQAAIMAKRAALALNGKSAVE